MDFCLLLEIEKNIGKNISKNVSSKFSQKLHHAKQDATDALETVSKNKTQKTAKVTVDLIGNKIANRITNVSNTSPQNNSETEMKTKILDLVEKCIEKYLYLQKEDLRLYNKIIMEYLKMINLLNNTPNQPLKFRTRNWVEINDESRGNFNISNKSKFKPSMIRSNLCDYSATYIHIKETITVPNTGTAAVPHDRNKKVLLKNCAPFTNWISEINNTQVGDAHDIDAVTPMYNLIEYNDVYYKPALGNNNSIIDFLDDKIIVFCSNVNSK